MAAEEVVFDFGFGAGGADGEAAAVGEVDEEHFFFGDLDAFFVEDDVGGEVADACDGAAVDLGGGIGGVAVSEGGDLGGTLGSFEDFALVHFEEVANFGVDFVEQAGDGEAPAGGVGGEFGEHYDSAVAVFVAREVVAHVAVAFFIAEDHEGAVLETSVARFDRSEVAVAGADVLGEGGFVIGEFGADPFETGQGVDDLDAVFDGDSVLHGAGDESLEDDGAIAIGIVEDAEVEHGFDTIPGHDGTGLVAGEEDHFTGGVTDTDAHAVAIGVGADDNVGAFFVGEIDGHLEGGRVFGVGGFDGGEAAIWHVLFGDGEEVEAESLEDGGNEDATGTVEGGEDDFEFFGGLILEEFGPEHDGLDLVQEGLIHFVAEGDDLTAFGFREGIVGFASDGIDFGDDARGVGFDDTGTVVEIDFVAVVVGGVVGGGDHDAGVGAEAADCEGHFRGGAEAVEEVDIHAEIGSDFGAEVGEFGGEVAGVVSKNDGGATVDAGVGAPVADVGHETSGGTAQVIKVHGIGADAGLIGALISGRGAFFGGGDDFADGATSETAGAEFEALEESVVEFFKMAAFDEFLDAGAIQGVLTGS